MPKAQRVLSHKKSVLSYPGVMEHAQQVALALHESGELIAMVTSFVFREDRILAELLKKLPARNSTKLLRQLRRRAITAIPSHLIHSYPFWELVRSLLARSGAGAKTIDEAWAVMSHRFDAIVANRYVEGADVIHAFEYTALASFQRAAKVGTLRVLHLPSLDSKSYEDIKHREQSAWPDLKGPDDPYFESKFNERYERRLQEISLADIIIVNSSLTKRSHVNAGADADKIYVVPLGAPPPASEIELTTATHIMNGTLTVLWAGNFSLGKGAQYFLEAWRQLDATTNARALVYGAISVPQGMLANPPTGITFCGSVPQPELFSAYVAADVLVCPSLSDGFGMVVTEALSRGLPVICTDQVGAADLIEHEVNGLIVKAADTNALTDALCWCLDNRQKLTGMRHAALESARQYQWSDYRVALNAAFGQAYAKHFGQRHGA